MIVTTPRFRRSESRGSDVCRVRLSFLLCAKSEPPASRDGLVMMPYEVYCRSTDFELKMETRLACCIIEYSCSTWVFRSNSSKANPLVSGVRLGFPSVVPARLAPSRLVKGRLVSFKCFFRCIRILCSSPLECWLLPRSQRFCWMCCRLCRFSVHHHGGQVAERLQVFTFGEVNRVIPSGV